MGCGTSVLPDQTPVHSLGKPIKPTESWDSGVGYELGSKESSMVESIQVREYDGTSHVTGHVRARGMSLPPAVPQATLPGSTLPDISQFAQRTFAERKPLPPHPLYPRAEFTERFLSTSSQMSEWSRSGDEEEEEGESRYYDYQQDSLRPLKNHIHEGSNQSQVNLISGLPRPPTPEFLCTGQGYTASSGGQELNPIRGLPPKGISQKHVDLLRHKSREQEVGEAMLRDLSDFNRDTFIAKRPPSRGGLAFDVVFGEHGELQDRVERLKKRQKKKTPTIMKKISRASMQKKLIAADLRRQQQTLETITNLSSAHESVEIKGASVGKLETARKEELKRNQEEAMRKAVEARRKHLENMRDRIRSNNERIRKANEAKMASRPPSRPSVVRENTFPSLLGF